MKNLKYMSIDWMLSEQRRLNARLGNLRKLALAGYEVEITLEQVTSDLEELRQEIDKRAESIHS